MASGTSVAGAALLLAAPAAAQVSGEAFPFPSRASGTSGFVTDVLTPHELRAQYDLWETRFIERCNAQGDARMRYPESNNDTRSEGVGYGMVIAAYFGDRETFDGLWNYYQRSSPGTGLMHWRRDGCNAGGGGADTGSAADADIDAAFGLIVADRQWPNQGYDDDAARIVGDIRQELFLDGQGCNGILLAGSTFRACGCINPSYIPPGYYPAFGSVNEAGFWNTARTNSYTYFANASNNTTGLVPAWSQASGATPEQCPGQPQVSGGGNTNEFQADAARTPWRVATDYLWSGNASASAFLQDIADFAKGRPIVHIVDRYSLAGQALNGGMTAGQLDATGFRSSFTMGGFATAMMASSQDDLDRFTGAWQSMYLPGDNIGPNGPSPRAFGSSLALLYGLVVTGYMWNPLGPNPTRVTPPALSPAGASNQIENGDFDEGVLNWSFANLDDPGTPGVRAEGFAVHKNGELHIEIPRAASRTEDPWEVRLSQTVSVQANQKYRISVRARAAAPRPFKVGIEAGDGQPYAFYGGLINRRGTGAITLTTEMVEYDTVFTSPMTNANARLGIDVADSDVTLIIDDVIFETTDLPVSTPGDLAGVVPDPDPNNPDPNNPDPNNPNNPTNPDPNNPNLGPVPNNGDNGSGVTPGDVNGGLPQPPNITLPPGTNGCTVDADCGGDPKVKCSTVLGLCYETDFGYVWSAAQNGWTRPPSTPKCGPDYVYWPLVNGCYDPDTGWAYDEAAMQWVHVGDNFTAGMDADTDGPADSGCAVSVAPGAEDTQGAGKWLLAFAATLAAAGLRRRGKR